MLEKRNYFVFIFALFFSCSKIEGNQYTLGGYYNHGSLPSKCLKGMHQVFIESIEELSGVGNVDNPIKISQSLAGIVSDVNLYSTFFATANAKIASGNYYNPCDCVKSIDTDSTYNFLSLDTESELYQHLLDESSGNKTLRRYLEADRESRSRMRRLGSFCSILITEMEAQKGLSPLASEYDLGDFYFVLDFMYFDFFMNIAYCDEITLPDETPLSKEDSLFFMLSPLNPANNNGR